MPRLARQLYCAARSRQFEARQWKWGTQVVDAGNFADTRFMTVTEVAEMMRVSRMTVYRMIHAGELPAVRFGRSYRVPESAVEQILQTGATDHRATGTDGRSA
ncbi:hypothetical protein GCM10009670_23700 [Citricoccus alkalitolerans]